MSPKQPPTPPGEPRPLPPSQPAWPTTIGIVGIVLCALSALALACLFFIYAVNMPTQPRATRAVFTTDAAARLVAAALLLSGSVHVMRRKRSGVILLMVWATLRLAWPFLAAAMFIPGREPSPELLAVALPTAVTFNAGLWPISLLMVLAIWLTPPLFVLLWFPRKRHEIARWSTAAGAVAA